MNTLKVASRSFIVAVLAIGLSFIGLTTRAEAVNRLGWSQAQAEAWQHMRSVNHKYYQDLKSQADNPGIYNDDGLRDGMMYLITGDAQYATRAWNHVSWYRGRTYNSGGSTPDRNATRAKFLQMSLLFSWIADGLSSQNKASFRDVLDYWSDLIFSSSHGTRPWDSDEMTGHYFGLIAYALALQDEDPGRASELMNKCGLSYSGCVGGVDSTGSNWNSWRNTITDYSKKAAGGQWMESSVYNLNSARYMIFGVAAINNHFGKDMFPEMTARFQEFADAMVNELTPDRKDSFQWGDVQSGNLRNLTPYSRLGLMSAIAGVSGDPKARHILNSLYNSYSSTPESHVFPFLDSRGAEQAPSGITHHNARGRGVALHHSGWDKYDSFFASTMFNPTNLDHERESVANFNLYRNGSWAITNPRGYYGDRIEAPYMNGMLINGGVAMAKEARGQAAYEAGDSYLYHVGLTGGQVVDSNYYDPPPEFINEYSRSHLYLHHANGADTVVIFDRIKADDPRTSMSSWKFGRLPQLIKDRINAADGKHQWIIHMPEVPSINGNNISWVSEGGETIQLKTFINGYTTAVYDEKASHNQGAPLYLGGYMTSSDLKYQLRIIPNQKNGFMNLLNVVHAGTQLNATELVAASGDQARGVYLVSGAENALVFFNGTEGAPLTPTSCCEAKHDPERFNKINELRKFKNGFSLNVNSKGHTEVYVADLDPAKQWKANVKGSEFDVAVSPQGLGRFSYSESGVHSFSIFHTGIANQPPAAVIAVSQINGLAVKFDGSASFDPDSGALVYSWNFGDGKTSAEINPNHTYNQAGEYTVTLTVNDGSLNGTAVKTVKVGIVNTAPKISPVSDKSVKAGDRLDFTVNASDPEGDKLTLTARLGNGDPLSTLGASFTDLGNGSGAFSFSPTTLNSGVHLMVFKASDGKLDAETTMTVTVYEQETDGSVPEPEPLPASALTIEAENFEKKTIGAAMEDGWNIWSDGYIEHSINFPAAGQYTLEIMAKGQLYGNDLPKMDVRLNQGSQKIVEVGSTAYRAYWVTVNVPASGVHKISLAFINDSWGGSLDKNRDLLIDKVTVYGAGAAPEPVGYCGDGIVNNAEKCDGTSGISGGQTCSAACSIIEPEPEPEPDPDFVLTVEAENFEKKTIGAAMEDGWNIWGNGYIEHSINFPAAGQYTLEIMAKGQLYGSQLPKMDVRLNQSSQKIVEVGSTAYRAYRVTVNVPASGSHKLALAFTNDAWGGSSSKDRNLLIDKVTVYDAGAKLEPLPVFVLTVEAENFEKKTIGGAMDNGWNIWSNGYIEQSVDFPAAGQYTLEIMAKGHLYGSQLPKMDVRLNQGRQKIVEVGSTEYQLYTVVVNVPTPGVHKLALAFTNDAWGGSSSKDRNLLIDKVTIRE
jgi:hypothetical protein